MTEKVAIGQENDDGRAFRQESPSKKKVIEKWKTRAGNNSFNSLDLVYIIILGVLGGIISSYFPFETFLKGIVPGLNPYPQLIGGHHLLWMVIALGLTRHRGSGLSVALIKGFFEYILIDQFIPGIGIIWLNLFEGFMVEVGFAAGSLFRKSKKRIIKFALAGAFGNVLEPAVSWALMGRLFNKPPWFLAVACVFACISGIVFAGILSYSVVRGLNRAGIGKQLETINNHLKTT
ncbi:MAG: ECF transporter S component [Promethearchaeota archaeon]